MNRQSKSQLRILILTLALAIGSSMRLVGQNDTAPEQPVPKLSAQEQTVLKTEIPDATTSKKALGLVQEKPQGNRYVETKQGYMVPYKVKIPGSKVEFIMVPIPGGKLRMGSPNSESDRRADEGPQFEVNIEPFWIGKHEVTWAEYRQYMRLDRVFKAFNSRGIREVKRFDGTDAVTAPSSLYDPSFTFEAGEEPNQPAATMSQFAAKQYTKWLSLLVNDFYCLPTEAQWEYACRAGTTSKYYFGDDDDELEDHAWYYDNADEQRHEVGQLKPNPWGLYDMYGNVAEWTLDQYVADAYKKFEGKSLTAREALVKPNLVFPRVLRGGSWELEAEDCRSAARFASDEEWRDEDPNYPQSPWWYTTSPGLGTGFRIIRPLNAPKTQTAKEDYWKADVERIFKDAKNRIEENGKGAFGIVDGDLPAAIDQLNKDK